MVNRIIASFVLLCLILPTVADGQTKSDAWLEQLFKERKDSIFHYILNAPEVFQYQIIYTRIDRDKTNKPTFKNFYLNVDRDRYFYPASTIKLPVALLSLEKLNELKVGGLNRNTTMFTDSAFSGHTKVYYDSTAENGLPSIGHYVRKIFIVSDNDAYNNLYDFVGQQEINEKLWKKGYPDIRVTHRFVRRTWEENKHTAPIRFIGNNEIIYQQPLKHSRLKLDTTNKISIGKRYMSNDGNLVNQPMNFTLKNRMPLEDLQSILQSFLFPESASKSARFNLTEDDRNFVLQSMSTYPTESTFPKYDSGEFFESYTKFIFFRDQTKPIPRYLRIFNKAGWSYGCFTDAAYVVDFKNNIEFMLTAVIYANRDETLNDDQYDDKEIAYPFFRAIGETIYAHELERKRTHVPDLKAFRFSYNK